MIIAIDFDGTIVREEYPGIGKAKFMAVPIIKYLLKRHCCILWTCREGDKLDKATRWCKQNGLHFGWVNRNTDRRILQYRGDCRKISCDLLVDDKAGFVFWPWVFLKILLRRGRQ